MMSQTKLQSWTRKLVHFAVTHYFFRLTVSVNHSRRETSIGEWRPHHDVVDIIIVIIYQTKRTTTHTSMVQTLYTVNHT